MHVSIGSNMVKPLSEEKRDRTLSTIFKAIKDKKWTEGNLKDIDKSIEFNRYRLRSQGNNTREKRLTQRIENLKEVKKHFESKAGKFLGLVGWGEGCLEFGLQARRNISSVDGYLWKDDAGHIHYQRLGSCLELFLASESKNNKKLESNKGHGHKHLGDITIITRNGQDINFRNQKVLSYSQEQNIEISNTRYVFLPQLNTLYSLSREKADFKPTYTVNEESHGDHSHFKLVDINSELNNEVTESKVQIGQDDEGCPCCTNAIDLDELAAIVKSASSSEDYNDLHERVETGELAQPEHWAEFFSVAFPFGIIGLTAAFRNITISRSNLKAINESIEVVQAEIDKKVQEYGTTERKKKADSLKAYLETLKYSRVDARFNFTVPGMINGAASALVLSTAFWTQAFALPVMSLYAIAQTGRNVWDYNRVRNRSLNKNEYKLKQDNYIRKSDKKESVELHTKKDKINFGKNKVNQIGKSKRRFFASNAFNFLVFSTGAALTFTTLASGVGIPLGIGIGLLAYGAITTGFANNIWPNKFKPRNASLGISRDNLNTETALENIGEKRQIKRLLKNNVNRNIKNGWGSRPRAVLRVISQVTAALPFLQSISLGWKHSLNEGEFKNAKHKLELSRPELLKNLLKIKGIEYDEDIKTFEDQWHACELLGIDAKILHNLAEKNKNTKPSRFRIWLKKIKILIQVLAAQKVEEQHNCKSGGCSGSHSNSEYETRLKNTGMFDFEEHHDHDHGNDKCKADGKGHGHAQCNGHSHGHGHGHENGHGHAQCNGHSHGHGHGHSHGHGHGHENGHRHAQCNGQDHTSKIHLKKIKDSLEQIKEEQLKSEIDRYLNCDWIKTLRYEERGLDDFFWQLKEQEGKRNVSPQAH